MQYIQFNTVVSNVKRNADDNVWLVSTKNINTGKEQVKRFNKVVLATGGYNTKHQPTVTGSEKSTGDILHSQQLKDPSSYAGKNVMVVGAGPTGADTIRFLEEAGAAKIYLSLRSGFTMVSACIN